MICMRDKSGNISDLWCLFSKRQQEILRIINSSSDGVSVQELGDELKMSTRTISNDVKRIAALLEGSTSARLLRVDKVCLLEVSESDRTFLINQQSSSLLSTQEKIFIIKKLLLNEKQKYTLQSIADELGSSRTSICQAIGALESWLSSFSIFVKKKRNRGIFVEGEEYNKRIAIIEFFRDIVFEKNPDYNQARNNYRIDQVHIEVLNDLLPGFDGNPVLSYLCQFDKKNEITISPLQFATLWFSMCLGIYRYKQGLSLSIENLEFNRIISSNSLIDYSILKQICNEGYKVSLPEVELSYLTQQLESSGLLCCFTSEGNSFDTLSPTFTLFAKEVISTIEEILNIDFLSNPYLRDNLIQHLSSSVFRLSYGIRIKNPFLSEIKKNYTSAFGATWGCSVLFDKYFNLRITEDEIGYLALYVASILEQGQKIVKVCLVCNYGVGISGLLYASLLNYISNIKITHQLSSSRFYELRQQGYSDWDIVISTVNIKEMFIPVIHVPSILSFNDFERIKSNIKNISKSDKKKVKTLSGSIGHPLINVDNVFINHQSNNKEDLLSQACDVLLSRGNVTKDFYQSLIDREKVISTEIGSGVSIPHGDPSFVKVSSILYYRLKKAIPWTIDKEVDMVFVLALNMNAERSLLEKRFFSKLAELISDSQSLSDFLKLDDPDTISDYFNKES